MKAKKIMSVLLAACLTLGLGACGSGTAGENTAGTVSEQSAQAEEAAEADSRFRVNAEALKAVQPADLCSG